MTDTVPAAPRSPWRETHLGAALLAFWAGLAAAHFMNGWAPDLSALYFAARFFGQGALDQVYASPAAFFGPDLPAAWLAEAAALGRPEAALVAYIYPPLWAALAAPLATALGPLAFFNLIWGVQIAMMTASVWLAWRLARPGIWPGLGFAPWAAVSVALLATSMIAYQALFQNQVQITVAFLILLAFERLSAGRSTAAGIALGLAAALKLTPILLIALFLVERDRRASLAALATAGGLAALSLVLAGPDLHKTYLDQLALVSAKLSIWDYNYALRALLWQTGEIVAGRPLPPAEIGTQTLVTPPAWIDIAAPAILAAGALGAWWTTRALPRPARLARRLAVATILVPLCSPLAWAHQFLAVVFLMPLLIAPGAGRIGAALLALFALHQSSFLLPYWATLGLAGNPTQATSVAVLAALALWFAWPGTRAARTQAA